MDATRFLQRLAHQRFFDRQIQHVEALPPRPPAYAEVQDGLHPAVQQALEKQGITRLYAHQAEAIAAIRAGRNVVVVTGTASGKTLCYNIPAVEAYLSDPFATGLFIYPTKALTQDQLRALAMFEGEDKKKSFVAGTYDGDTPQNLRRKLRDAGNFVLTNPDMLHQGILPQHARWNRFFTHLKYVVIDEVHAYRGVFGSHLANVLRRLARICRHYGATPQFICSSATIANPQEHAARITGHAMELVTEDGSPRGPKRFVMWNPPPIVPLPGREAGPGVPRPEAHAAALAGGDRRSPLWEAVYLLAALVQEGVQTIVFVRTRQAAELVYRNTRELLRPHDPRLAEAIRAYRGGYLPEERRAIERQLVNREILGVASTNALELGIDIGSLDACILVGYPGTVASLWQQAGRAGRGREEAIVFLVAQNSPIDQYLMTHCSYLFAQSPEQAVVDPENPHIAVDYLRCAAHELPLSADELPLFGPYAPAIMELLVEDQAVSNIDGRWYWARSDYPAAKVNLRNIVGAVYTIQHQAASERVIGTLDEVSALSQLHDHAVYLHAGETYFIHKLDLQKKIAFAERRDLDYYTQSVQVSQIRIDRKEEEAPAPQHAEGDPAGGQPARGVRALLGFGDVTVTTTIPMFRKIRFHSRDSLGFEKLELPPQQLETVALWLAPPEPVVARMREQGMVPGEALIGLANVLVEMAQIYVMCDVRDIGTTVDAACLGRDALFLYDRYPGGMGYARRCLDHMPEILEACRTVINDCACESGCPSCVGAAVPAFAQTDLDSAVRGRIPDKRAALFLLQELAP
ncbi:MAG: DEAD/DEAH box helicase [Planctomycetota bacterium]|nr:DEAD/DEAH box helicase [Planctomycetota bacterium]